MVGRATKQAPIVRLPPKSNIEILMTRSAQVAMIFVGFVALVFALYAAEFILAPIFLGVVIGLMLGPVATRLDMRGIPSGLSALLVLLLFLAIVASVAMMVATPLSFWVDRLPQLWSQLQRQLADLKGPMEALRNLREELKGVTGGEGVTVTVDEGVPVGSFATFAPAFAGQLLLFFASLYFFVATRRQTRETVLRLCFDRRMRWRVAHIFQDVESMVSRYLLSITVINLAEGALYGVALWIIGVPSAALWGVIAALANFVVFIGPACVAVLMFAVGLTEYDTLGASLIPVAVYLSLNTLEAQFVTPLAIGRAMTMNPFIVLLALAFWIWLWGPIGGFVAIPAVLIVYAVARNIVPGVDWLATHPAVGRTTQGR